MYTEWLPEDLGALNNADLSQTANAIISGPMVDLRDAVSVEFIVNVTLPSSDGSAGTFSLEWQRQDRHGNDLGDPIDLITGLDSFFVSANTLQSRLVLGDGLAKDNTATVVLDGDGTVGAGLTAGNVHMLGRGVPEIDIDTLSDATTPTVDVTILAMFRNKTGK